MKQEKDIETKAQSQNQQGIEDTGAGHNKAINRGYPHLIKFRISTIWESQGLGRDGPPGCARSPGTLANQFPDHPPDNGSLTLPEFSVALEPVERSKGIVK